ncbi:efflux RND transporter permease subunit [Mechercharimyces sp. CAU 1602]|uniref:efflux RND transporter permease subunit n=1 Tax=Mechercharimyces sp. CAU 1602 TaxID=2973933 RepID=UPI00216325C5|nr:efflux RND transporter permease subunit [Mechercharimyces sp. CAU 1602]MCS1351873.1 efflux RND transporter permease subunit [Mechercharimyces sp. CAU 1602]
MITWLTKWAFKNRAAVIVMVIITLVLGAISYTSLPREFLPSADQPLITVVVFGQGADSATVARQVTDPVEEAVNTVKGKTSVLSTSSDGFSKVDLYIDADADIDEVSREVEKAVGALNLPEGYSKPAVSQLNTDMIPLWQLGVSFPGEITRESMEKVETEVIPRFEKIDGVASVGVYGKQTTEVLIDVDQEKMAQYQVPVQALQTLLSGKNISVAVGSETVDGKTTNIKVVGELDSVKSLENLQVTEKAKLKDVANVKVVSQGADEKFITRIDGKEAVSLIMMKEASANAVATGEKVVEAMESLNEEYASDFKITTLINFSDFIVNSVNSMMKEVLLGALFATVIILLFLRNFRMTLISILSIPLSIGLTLFLLSMSGITLNILTLGAVAVAVGRLVDDSIVVIENIYRRAQHEAVTKEMVVDATREVALAITSSTLATVVVFLPIGLVKSMKELLLPFSLTITYSLIASLLVALLVVPLMSKRLLKQNGKHREVNPIRYKKMLTWSLNHKWLPLVMAAILFIGSLALFTQIPQGVQEAADNDLSVMVEYPNAKSFQEVKEESIQLEKFLQTQSGVEHINLLIGSNPEDAQWGQVKSPNQVEYFITMKDGADTERIQHELEEETKKYPDGEFNVQLLSMTPGGNSTIDLDLSGGDSSDLLQAAKLVEEKMATIDGVEKVSSNMSERKPTLAVEVDINEANPQEIATQVSTFFHPVPIGMIQIEGKETRVALDLTQEIQNEKDIEKLPIATATGVTTLGQVAEVEKSDEATSIYRKNGEEYVRISVKAEADRLSTVAQNIQVEKEKIELPDGVKMTVGGASEEQAEQYQELFFVMLISIAIVYLLMVMTFRTLRAPLVILFTLPLALIGAVLGLVIAQISVDLGAMIGALMLIGIVVTNAIVFIDRVKQNEEKMNIRDALIEAGATRLRPILMTALATICAMLPLLFMDQNVGSLVSKGLAVVVISGLAVATLLTLIIIPVVYELLHFRKSKKQRIEKAEQVTTTV